MTNEQILRKALAEIGNSGRFRTRGNAVILAEILRSMRSHARKALIAAKQKPERKVGLLPELAAPYGAPKPPLALIHAAEIAVKRLRDIQAGGLVETAHTIGVLDAAISEAGGNPKGRYATGVPVK